MSSIKFMMEKREAEEIFEGVCKDPQRWLAQANQLKVAADVIEVELQDTMIRMRVEKGLEEIFPALLKSFMFLVGIAIENLIKGILIGRDSSLISRELIKKNLVPRGGHGISKAVEKLCEVSCAEIELLRRLEEYLVWAGKYPMPLRSNDFHKSQTPENLCSFSWADFKLIDNLFDRLAEILDSEWSERDRAKDA